MLSVRATGSAVPTFFALVIGLGALRYALPSVPYPAPLPNFEIRRAWLVTHATFSALAMIAGPWQFLASFRRRSLDTHRWTGRVYCAAVAIAWVTSLPIASHAQTGPVASAGFLTLGAFWIATTAAGYFTIRAGRRNQHREWMIRSYALTAAAITLRIYLPLFTLAGIPFAAAYPAISWLCWIPNLLLAEWLVRRSALHKNRIAADKA